MNWGYYIKQLRKEAGLTQNELAKRSGLKRPHISNIERGVYKSHRKEVIESLARGLGKTAKEVVDRIYGIDEVIENPEEEHEEIHLTCFHKGNTYSGSLKRVS